MYTTIHEIDDSGVSIEKTLGSTTDDINNHLVLSEEQVAILHNVCKGILTDREHFVIIRYYGLDGEKRATLEELSHNFDMTKMGISKLIKRTLLKLKKYLISTDALY